LATVASRIDPVRSSLAGLAALLAAVGGYLWAVDRSVDFQNAVVPYTAAAALTAGTLAIAPSGGRWKLWRRAAAAFLALAWVVAAIPMSLFLIAVSACACIGDPSYVAPTILGLGAHLWVSGATISGPLLLLLAASPLPDRLLLPIRRSEV
jgi:hypothetical protein